MAKRRKARGFFRRSSPDRGWYINEFTLSVTAQAGTSSSVATLVSSPLFDFFDVNNDNTLITQDKSDWFIKRMIVSVYPTLSRANLTSPTARLWQCGFCTMSDSVAGDLVTGVAPVISATVYDGCKRMFRSYTRPVYATAVQSITSGNLQVTATTGSVALQTLDSPWGGSYIDDDFEVSNASLFETDSVNFLLSTTLVGPGSYDWAVSDQVAVAVFTKTLLQKRRT